MTEPKQYLPGQVVMMTRRTVRREFLLRPDIECSRIVGYSYFRWANRRIIDLHGGVVMSNHPHLIFTDRKAQRDGFLRDSHSLTARKVNLLRNRRGHLFDAREPDDLVLLDLEIMLQKLLYVWLNPVVAGLVAHAKDWPGFSILPYDWGERLTIRRPKLMGSTMPEFEHHTPMPPDQMLEDFSLEEAKELAIDLLEEHEKRIAIERRKKGLRRVLGPKKAKKVNPFGTPKSQAPMRERAHRYAAEKLADWQRAQRAYRDFLARYRDAREKWLEGEYEVVFPEGTIQLDRLARINRRPVVEGHPCLPRPPNSDAA